MQLGNVHESGAVGTCISLSGSDKGLLVTLVIILRSAFGTRKLASQVCQEPREKARHLASQVLRVIIRWPFQYTSYRLSLI